MTIDLSQITFDYDFFSAPMPDGSMLILNRIDEDMDDGTGTASVKAINVVIAELGGGSTLCSSVIGMGNSRLMITSAHEELLGKTLTEENMASCFIEMEDK